MSAADHGRDPWYVPPPKPHGRKSANNLTGANIGDSPYVILNDFGGAFSMGAIGGGIWHGIKGARNSPRVCFFHFETTPSRNVFLTMVSPLSQLFAVIPTDDHLITRLPYTHRASVSSDPSLLSKPVRPCSVVTLAFGVVFSQLLTVRSRGIGKRRIHGTPSSLVS